MYRTTWKSGSAKAGKWSVAIADESGFEVVVKEEHINVPQQGAITRSRRAQLHHDLGERLAKLDRIASISVIDSAVQHAHRLRLKRLMSLCRS